MARLFQSGFELNSTTANVEWDSFSTNATISTNHVLTGNYAARINSTASSESIQKQIKTSGDGTNTVYFRAYIYYVAFPSNSSNGNVMSITTELLTTVRAHVRCSTAGTLGLFDKNNTQIGSSSSTLTLKRWYQLELSGNPSTLEFKLDGVIIASGAPPVGFTWGGIILGDAGLGITQDVYFDNIAVNDSTGAFQNGYPGQGSIVYLRPGAAGDSTQWTPDTGSNFARVNEVTPDDATSLILDSVLNDSDFYTCLSFPSVTDLLSINVVQIGVRFSNDVADATTAFKVQIKKVSGGTITQSSAITPNSTTWKTNATAAPFLSPLTLYQDPDSINWTLLTINTMQIGVQSTLIGVNKNQVSTIWASIDYSSATPSKNPPVNYLRPAIFKPGLAR